MENLKIDPIKVLRKFTLVFDNHPSFDYDKQKAVNDCGRVLSESHRRSKFQKIPLEQISQVEEPQ